jgi:hypothetical protein
MRISGTGTVLQIQIKFNPEQGYQANPDPNPGFEQTNR